MVDKSGENNMYMKRRIQKTQKRLSHSVKYRDGKIWDHKAKTANISDRPQKRELLCEQTK